MKSSAYFFIGIVVVIWGVSLGAAQEGLPAPTQDDYRSLRSEVEEQLRNHLLQAWFPRCLDREQGGYWLGYDASWQRTGAGSKALVTQSRQLWVAAQAGRMYPDDARYREAADHGFRYLQAVLWDRQCGGFFWEVARDGTLCREFQDNKHAYGLSFALYALCAYYRLTGQQEALELARQTFDWLDWHGHDPVHGGYYEYFTRVGKPILSLEDNPLGRAHPYDMVGALPGYKDMNTHIHLLESLTAFYEIDPRPNVRARLEELLELVCTKIATAPGALHYYFRLDWQAVPDHDSFGHDVETAYLITEAMTVLGRQDAKVALLARSLVDNPLRCGWDKEEGGFYYAGSALGRIHDRDKQWWVMAEGMNALLLMHTLYPSMENPYWELFCRNWMLFRDRFLDRQAGGVYTSLSPQTGGMVKGSNWKGCYHDGRALMNCVRMLGTLAGQQGETSPPAVVAGK